VSQRSLVVVVLVLGSRNLTVENVCLGKKKKEVVLVFYFSFRVMVFGVENFLS
jgi:hypothetical protein